MSQLDSLPKRRHRSLASRNVRSVTPLFHPDTVHALKWAAVAAFGLVVLAVTIASLLSPLT